MCNIVCTIGAEDAVQDKADALLLPSVLGDKLMLLLGPWRGEIDSSLRCLGFFGIVKMRDSRYNTTWKNVISE